MKKTTLRILAVLLVATLFVAMLAGCRSEPDQADFIFMPEFISLPDGISSIQNLSYSNNTLYFVSYITNEETWESFTKIFTMNIDGSNITELEGYVPLRHPHPEATGSSYIMSFGVDNDGNIWITETGWYQIDNTPPGFMGDWEEGMQYIEDLGSLTEIRKLDATGTEIFSLDLIRVLGDSFQTTAFGMDNEGNLYIGLFTYSDMGYDMSYEIAVLGSDGSLKFKLEARNWINELVTMPDGSVAVIGYEETAGGSWSQVLRKINPTTQSWGDPVELPQRAWRVYPGVGDYLVFYQDDNNLNGINAETGESVRLINWIESGLIPNSLDNILALPDGRIICVNRDYGMGAFGHNVSLDLIIFSKIPYSELPERIEITFAAMYFWELRSAIVNFNRTNQTYRIKVIDYSEFNTEDDWNAGLTRLSTDIISGNIPDILDLQGLPFYQYVARDFLVDLYTLIDADPEFNRSDFVESVFRAAEIDGGLYRAFPSFYVSTLIGHPSVLGPDMGWNMDEFRAVLNANPQADMLMGQWLTKENFLMATVLLSLDEYIDWASGRVSFDAGGFAQLLEFSNRFPAEPPDFGDNWENYIEPEELIREGRQIMSEASIAGFDNIEWYIRMFGGDIVFKGFPTESRNGNSLFINTSLAITTSSDHADGAWEFLRTILTSNWQRDNTWGFPTNMELFNEKIEEAMREREDEMWPGFARDVVIDMPGFPTQTPPLTQAQIDQVIALINSATNIFNYDEALINIIQEGAHDFFTGRSSAEAAARVVQSRVQIYVAERR